MNSLPVLGAALWLSALAFTVVALVSLQAGATPSWAVLRGLGAFAVFLTLGFIAEAIAHWGLRESLMTDLRRRAAAEAEADQAATAGAEARIVERPALVPDLVSNEEEHDVRDAA